MKNQTDVLVIGGGFGGVMVAQNLAKNGVDVTLLDRKDYFEVTFATTRNVANPNLLGDTARKYYADFITGNFIQADVESMNAQEVQLVRGESIAFRRAVIATGSRYPTLKLAKSDSAFSYAERKQELLAEHKTLEAAKSILIIGGGFVGVEFAGEIASAFPNKDLSLAHRSACLLDAAPPKVRGKALEQLRAKGVKVKLKHRFTKDGDLYRCSITNETMQPDIAYACIGMLPNTEFLRAELPNILTDRALVKVDENMKVRGYSNLYSLGDCASLDKRKHGYLAGVQGKLLADSLLRAAGGKKPKPYKSPPLMIITSTGTDTGVATLPFFGLTSTRASIINLKKDMGISNMYKSFGTKADPFAGKV